MARGLAALVLVSLYAATARGEISCSVHSVLQGQSTNLTCNFNEDIRVVKKNIKVQHHLSDTFDHDKMKTVLDCYWQSAEDFRCNAADGYVLQGKVTSTAVLRIVSASQDQAGKYTCESVPSDPADIKSCIFKLQALPDDKIIGISDSLQEHSEKLADIDKDMDHLARAHASTNAAATAAAIITAAVLLVVVVVAVAAALLLGREGFRERLGRYSCSRRQDKGKQPGPGQEDEKVAMLDSPESKSMPASSDSLHSGNLRLGTSVNEKTPAVAKKGGSDDEGKKEKPTSSMTVQASTHPVPSASQQSNVPESEEKAGDQDVEAVEEVQPAEEGVLTNVQEENLKWYHFFKKRQLAKKKQLEQKRQSE